MCTHVVVGGNWAVGTLPSLGKREWGGRTVSDLWRLARGFATWAARGWMLVTTDTARCQANGRCKPGAREENCARSLAVSPVQD